MAPQIRDNAAIRRARSTCIVPLSTCRFRAASVAAGHPPNRAVMTARASALTGYVGVVVLGNGILSLVTVFKRLSCGRDELRERSVAVLAGGVYRGWIG